MKSIFAISFILFFTGCKEVSTDIVVGAKGKNGLQTPIFQDTEGNILGYYEYLPNNFSRDKENQWPLIFFWNGQNTVTGNGKSDLNKLLDQGLPNLINKGHQFPAVIISGMVPVWNKTEIAPFIEYIIKRYDQHIDRKKIYMTGFSAGGGITLRYVSAHPEHIAAIVPIAPAAQPPTSKQPTEEMAKVSSWFFHNSGDMTVEIWRSNMWNKALRDMGGDHRITRPDLESHYAWKETYLNQDMWDWLLSQSKDTVRLPSNYE